MRNICVILQILTEIPLIVHIKWSDAVCYKKYLKNNIKKIHYLDFGNNYKMSSCSCYTWKKSAYPCKHFFCSFSESCCLSGLYRNSPYLNLDDFDSSIQTGDFLQNNCAVINDEHKRLHNDSKIVQTETR